MNCNPQPRTKCCGAGNLDILMPALSNARAAARQLEDSKKQQSVHQGWLTHAAANKELFPTPSHIDALPHPSLGEQKGFGAPDWQQNTTPNMHSAAIMANLYTPLDLLAPAEPSPQVFPQEYNYDSYDPYNQEGDVHWDVNMRGDLSAGGEGCNFSYASMPLFGSRFDRQWKAGGSSDFAILSNRGPKDGEHQENSTNYLQHGNPDSWSGNVCFNDNQVSISSTGWIRRSLGETTTDKPPTTSSLSISMMNSKHMAVTSA